MFQKTRPGIKPKRNPSPIANVKTKASLWLRSCTKELSALKPNQIMAHNLIKNIGRKTKKSKPRATASPGKAWASPTKKTYFAQNRDVPGKPIVTKTPKTDIIHSIGDDRATPPT